MADDYGLTGTSASSYGQQPQQGTPPTSPAPGDGSNASSTEIENPTAKRYAEEAATERKARKALEAKLAEYTKAEEERKAAQLSDAERATKRAEAAEAKAASARKRVGSSELKLAAQTAGIIDPDVAIALLSDHLEYDEETDEPKNVAKLIEQLQQSKPHLFTGGTSAQQQSQPARPNVGQPMAPARSSGAAGPGALTMDIIAKMSPAEYAARYQEIEKYFARVTAEQRMRGY